MNYTMIGGDGKEYGPVSAEQLREWFAQNRVNAQTQLAAEGTEDWKPLTDYAEFAELATPSVASVSAAATPDDILARDYTLDIGSCISRSWDCLKGAFWPTIGTTLVVFLVMGGLSSIPFVGAVINLLISGPLMGGLYVYYLKRVRGEEPQFNDAFSGFGGNLFLPLMLAGILTQVLGLLGILCCVLPGIYLAVAYMFVFPVVVDKRLDAWQAMELSRKVVTRHWWQVLAFAIVGGLVGLLGLLLLIVGIFVTMPIFLGAVAIAYDDIFGNREATQGR